MERGALHHDFDRALWALEIGEVTGPIQISKVLDNGNELPQTEKTYHFIQLLDEQPEGLIPFNECREDIHSILEERERLTYRFKLLGIKDETLSADRNDQDGEYRNALLKAAYAREWDKNIVVVQKTEAYRRFHLADLLCQEKVDQVIKSQPVRTEEESIWVLRNETIDQILADMKFRILIKLDLPKSYNLSEDETSNLIQDE